MVRGDTMTIIVGFALVIYLGLYLVGAIFVNYGTRLCALVVYYYSQ